MINMKVVLPIIIIWMGLGLQGLTAQETILPLHYNPGKSKELLETVIKDGRGDTLSLPVWDDFTNAGPYPDASIWADADVYINNHLGVHPKTFGIATFDILDQFGRIYDHANLDNIPFVADHLSSHPIDLGGLNPADSVILSFYYQPQGMGGDPSTQDSLVLQFFLPDNGQDNGDEGDNGDEWRWQTVWAAPGQTLEAFAQDTFPYFKRVAVPIEEEIYFREDFRFRFRNWASFTAGGAFPFNSGSGNIWNIDYVYLDQGRSTGDAYYYDVAFAAPAQSMLHHHTSVPWSQYIASPNDLLRDNFDVRITNLDQSTYTYSYRYVIQDENGHTIRTYSGGSWVIAPFSQAGYQEHPQHANPIVLANPLPTAPADKRHFHVVHSLQEGATGDDYRRNDTITFKQVFSNYFAYDYGRPQRVQLLRGIHPSRATQFILNHPDSLEAVKFFFTETIDMQDDGELFELVVWKSLHPVEELYRSDPILAGEMPRNQYHPIYLEEPILLADTFYVGITQLGQNVENRRSIALGYDMRNNMQHRNYFDAGEGWLQSIEQGTPMIRPQMRRDHITSIPPVAGEAAGIGIYPNPGSGSHIHIRVDSGQWDASGAMVMIYDAGGRLVHNAPYHPSVDVSALSNGLYILRLADTARGISQTARFIIAR